jgi:hypothetical protein
MAIGGRCCRECEPRALVRICGIPRPRSNRSRWMHYLRFGILGSHIRQRRHKETCERLWRSQGQRNSSNPADGYQRGADALTRSRPTPCLLLRLRLHSSSFPGRRNVCCKRKSSQYGARQLIAYLGTLGRLGLPVSRPLAQESWACRSLASYCVLARDTWRRRKGRYTRRAVAVIEIAIYRISSRLILANTCCTALIGNGGTAPSSVPLPP